MAYASARETLSSTDVENSELEMSGTIACSTVSSVPRTLLSLAIISLSVSIMTYMLVKNVNSSLHVNLPVSSGLCCDIHWLTICLTSECCYYVISELTVLFTSRSYRTT